MSRHQASELASPVSPSRTSSIRKLANTFLRPSRRAPPTLSKLDNDNPSPPSSPSLYSLSSDTESRSNIHHEPLPVVSSPTASDFSVSASEGHGPTGAARRPTGLELVTAGLDVDRSGSSSPKSRRPQRSSADFSWAMNNTKVRPRRIIIGDDQDGAFINSDAASLRAGGVWDAPLAMSPSEWLSPTTEKRRGSIAGFGDGDAGRPLSPVESPNGASSSDSSPATPRFRSTSEMQEYGYRDVKPTPSPSITETPSASAGSPRRARSSSEPQRLFLASPVVASGHAGTVPSTPTRSRAGFITPGLDEAPRSPTSPFAPSSPSSRRSSMNTPIPSTQRLAPLPTPIPNDVYFTAAGRRESRLYITPDPTRGHSHSNSEPQLSPPSEMDTPSGSLRYATWNSYRKRATTTTSSSRPFEEGEAVPEGMRAAGDSTPVHRKEQMWTGEWNRDDIQDVIQGLRSLK